MATAIFALAASQAVTALLLHSWLEPELASTAEGLPTVLSASVATVELFGMWNKSQPAHFTGLRSKGGFLVNASWDHVDQAPANVTVRSSAGLRLQMCALW